MLPNQLFKSKLLTRARVEITGDKSAKVTAKADDTNVIELKRLAGL